MIAFQPRVLDCPWVVSETLQQVHQFHSNKLFNLVNLVLEISKELSSTYTKHFTHSVNNISP